MSFRQILSPARPAHDGPGDPVLPPSSEPVNDATGPWDAHVVSSDPSWFTSIPPSRKWLLRDARTNAGVLPLGKVGLLLAEGGLGKTMALVQLAIAMATGSDWLGSFTIPAPGKVLVILGEEDEEEAQRRAFNAVRSARARAPEAGRIVVMPLAGVPCTMVEADERGKIVDAPFLVWLRRYLEKHGPFSLVLVDPLSRFAGTDAETDNASATRFIQALESIATVTGATVLVAHHTNKDARKPGATVSGASARGSSAIFDGVRWGASMSAEKVSCNDPDVDARLGELVTLAIVKSNYSPKGDPVLLRRDRDNGGALLALDVQDHQIVSEARASSNPTAKRQLAKDERALARHSELSELVKVILRESPGLSGRALLAAVQAKRGSCSRATLDAAIASLGGALRVERGPDRSNLHYLAGDS